MRRNQILTIKIPWSKPRNLRLKTIRLIISVLVLIVTVSGYTLFATTTGPQENETHEASYKRIKEDFLKELDRIKDDAKATGKDIAAFKASDITDLITKNREKLDDITGRVNEMTDPKEISPEIADGLNFIAAQYKAINSFSKDFEKVRVRNDQRTSDMLNRNNRLIDENSEEITSLNGELSDLNVALSNASSNLEKSKLKSDISTKEKEKDQNVKFGDKLIVLKKSLKSFRDKSNEAMDIIEILLHQYGNAAESFDNAANYVRTVVVIAEITNSLEEVLASLDGLFGEGSGEDLTRSLGLLDNLINDIENL